MRKMKVQLKSVGNPDFNQNPGAPLLGCAPYEWREVTHIGEAVKVCQQWIEENDLGGGNWAGGDIRGVDGKVFARVAYNGAVFANDGTRI